jgi:hypothetical protein
VALARAGGGSCGGDRATPAIFQRADLQSEFSRRRLGNEWRAPRRNANAFGGNRTRNDAPIGRAHIGQLAAIRLPAWKREGYADYVAGETSLDPGDEARIRAKNPDAPVLVYYEGRRRVASILRENGGSIEALFAE